MHVKLYLMAITGLDWALGWCAKLDFVCEMTQGPACIGWGRLRFAFGSLPQIVLGKEVLEWEQCNLECNSGSLCMGEQECQSTRLSNILCIKKVNKLKRILFLNLFSYAGVPMLLSFAEFISNFFLGWAQFCCSSLLCMYMDWPCMASVFLHVSVYYKINENKRINSQIKWWSVESVVLGLCRCNIFSWRFL